MNKSCTLAFFHLSDEGHVFLKARVFWLMLNITGEQSPMTLSTERDSETLTLTQK